MYMLKVAGRRTRSVYSQGLLSYGLLGLLCGGQIEIAPIDSQIIAGLAEHLLRNSAHLERFGVGQGDRRTGNLLIERVGRQFAAGVEIELYAV